MAEMVERCAQNDKHGGRHDESQSVHWQVVMDAVEQEMGREGERMVGQPLFNVEQEAVENILDEGPEQETKEVTRQEPEYRDRFQCDGAAVDIERDPEDGHNVPCCFRKRFENVAENRRGALAIVSGLVDLFR